MTVNALLLSSSRVGDTPYLSHALPFIKPLTAHAQKWIFIPYAGVSMSYDTYLASVVTGLSELKLDISGIHQHPDPRQAIKDADGILIGGGNTFHRLLDVLMAVSAWCGWHLPARMISLIDRWAAGCLIKA